MKNFQVASTARRPGEASSDQLFVGEMAPHNAERPWLVIRNVDSAAVAIVVGSAVLPVERD